MSSHEGRDTVSIDQPTSDSKRKHENLAVIEVDSELGIVDEPRYSKLSVWLMVLYSGLAIGSDG